jgi:hypothetical protein
MKTEVVNINKEEYDVYIGRAGHGQEGYFGNPFTSGTRTEKIENFKRYAINRVDKDPEYREKVKSLYGKRLGCFCKPEACHGDVLAKLAHILNLEDTLL